MEVVKLPPSRVLDMIEAGEIKDGKTIIAILTAYRRRLI
jgi:hypothetical protein